MGRLSERLWLPASGDISVGSSVRAVLKKVRGGLRNARAAVVPTVFEEGTCVDARREGKKIDGGPHVMFASVSPTIASAGERLDTAAKDDVRMTVGRYGLGMHADDRLQRGPGESGKIISRFSGRRPTKRATCLLGAVKICPSCVNKDLCAIGSGSTTVYVSEDGLFSGSEAVGALATSMRASAAAERQRHRTKTQYVACERPTLELLMITEKEHQRERCSRARSSPFHRIIEPEPEEWLRPRARDRPRSAYNIHYFG